MNYYSLIPAALSLSATYVDFASLVSHSSNSNQGNVTTLRCLLRRNISRSSVAVVGRVTRPSSPSAEISSTKCVGPSTSTTQSCSGTYRSREKYSSSVRHSISCLTPRSVNTFATSRWPMDTSTSSKAFRVQASSASVASHGGKFLAPSTSDAASGRSSTASTSLPLPMALTPMSSVCIRYAWKKLHQFTSSMARVSNSPAARHSSP
mmetsp:Transcript_11975/g.54290  ORF Transcript_11975/g.54290 Transcript_11975/m.54290 type:complete len:207 (-) Transcript_11975:1970-2590(-)